MASHRSFSAVGYAARTNTTIPAPAGIANGDILLILFAIGGDSPGNTASPPAGFTAAPGYPTVATDASNFIVRTYLWVKVASGESGDYTVTHVNAPTTAYLVAVAGGDTSAPLSPNASNQTFNPQAPGGLTHNVSLAPGVTTQNDNSLVIFWSHAWELYGAASPPTGSTPLFTERYDSAGSILYVADGVLATAGATGDKSHTNPNAGSNESWAAGLIVVKNAPAAPAVTGTPSHARLIFNATTLTFPHTSDGNPLYVAVTNRNPVTTMTVTYGGVALTQLGSTLTANNNQARWWFLAAPAVGTANVVVVVSGTLNFITGVARNVSGVDRDGIYRNLTSAEATSTTPSITIGSAVGDLVLDFVSGDADSQVHTAGAGQTTDVAQNGATDSGQKVAASQKAGAASVTMSWTLSVSDAWQLTALSIPAEGTIPPNIVRVTQFPIELVSRPTPDARVSQLAIEVISRAALTGTPQLTQLVAETLILPSPPPARLTQLVAEILSTVGATAAPARLTQLVAEVLTFVPPVTPARLTQLVTELLTLQPPPAPGRVTQVPVELATQYAAPPARTTQLPVEIALQYASAVLPARVSQLPVEIALQYAAASLPARVSQVALEIIYPFGCYVYAPPGCPPDFPVDAAPPTNGCIVSLTERLS